MPNFDTVLLEWAAQYDGFTLGQAARASALTTYFCPTTATPTDRTVLGRWLTWMYAVQDFARYDLRVTPAQATELWRGLRTVAEGRAAPTSPFGAALNDIVANLSRLRGVTAADITFVGIGVGHFLDGVATHYDWQQRGISPTAALRHANRARTTGIWGAWALLSATRNWDVAHCLISHPARRILPTLEQMAVLASEPADAAEVASRQTAIRLTLASLPRQWADFSHWTAHLVGGMPEWSAQLWDDAIPDANDG